MGFNKSSLMSLMRRLLQWEGQVIGMGCTASGRWEVDTVSVENACLWRAGGRVMVGWRCGVCGKFL